MIAKLLPGQLTVSQLIELLKEIPGDTPVMLEVAYFIEEARSVRMWDGIVLITSSLKQP